MPREPSETGFKVNVSELLNSGWSPDRFYRNVPFWADVDAVDFTEYGIQKRGGVTDIVDLSSENIRGITTGTEYDTKVIYSGDLTSLWLYKLSDSSTKDVGSTYSLSENGGSTSWDSGTTTWDGGSTVWDEGLVEPSLWAFANFGTWVLAVNGVDEPQIKKNNITFNDLLSGEISGGSVNSGGSGHALGDAFTFTGGTGTGFTATVTEVSGGAVTAFEITAFGSGFTDGDTLTQSTTTGSGTGLTVDVTVSDSPYINAYTISQLGPHILMFNVSTSTSDSPFDFVWCSEDDPDTWVASSTNSAGSLTIREADTELRAAVPLGRSLAVYTTDQMFLVNYIGAPFYFGYNTALTHGVGAVSKQAVVSVSNKNYGLSKDGFFVTDGVTSQNIGKDNGINAYVKTNIAESEYAKVTAWHNKEYNEIVWNLPIGSTAVNTEVIYNYSLGTWTKKTSDYTYGVSSGVFDNPVLGDNAGTIVYGNGGNNAFTASITSRAHDLDDADSIKELTSIRIGKLGEGAPTVKIGWADTPTVAPTYVDSFVLDNTFVEHILRTAGRYLFLDIESTSADAWEITDVVIQGRTGGTR